MIKLSNPLDFLNQENDVWNIFNGLRIRRLNSYLIPTREEHFGIKSKKTLQDLEKRFNFKLHKRYLDMANYFLKSAEANTISKYNNNGSYNFETEIIFNKKANAYLAINIPDYKNLDTKIAKEIFNFSKLNSEKDPKEKEEEIFNYTINFLRNNFELKKADINLKEIPIPLKYFAKNSELFKEVFTESKEKSLVDISFLYSLNQEKYESENTITYNFSTKVDNIFDLSCKSQFEAESTLLDSIIEEIKCSVTGKRVFDNLVKNLAKETKTSVPTYINGLNSMSKEKLPQFHLAHNLNAIENFLHRRHGFSLSTHPKAYVTINEIIDFLNAGNFEIIKELDLNFKSLAQQIKTNEKRLSKNK